MTIPETKPNLYLSRFGVETWAEGVVDEADFHAGFGARHMAISKKAMDEKRNPIKEIQAHMRESQRHRINLIVYFYRLYAFAKWAVKCGAIPASLFSELFNYEREIIDMRNMNMHEVDYFEGQGRNPDRWITVSSELGSIDASSVHGDSLGGKLNASEMRSIAIRILDGLPPYYWETQ